MADARLPLYAPRGPSLARASALSGATTVNLLVLGALLLPATLAPTLKGPRLSEVEPALLATVVEVASVVLPSPEPTPVARPAPPRPTPVRVAVPVVEPTPTVTPFEAPAAAVADPSTATVATEPPAPVPAGPVEGALAYIEAPHPAYPQRALRQRAEGVVLLRVRVGSDGLPVAVELARSSGHPALDDAARRQVLRHWRFQPAVRDGRAVEAIGLVPVAFRLGAG